MNEQDWTNIRALVCAAPIKGVEAITVAVLIQKIDGMIASFHTPKVEDATPSKEAV